MDLVRTRVGIGVAADRVRLVGVRGETVLWASEAEVSDGTDLAGAITELIDAAPLPRWPRPQVTAALGPTCAQTKLLTGLPPLTDPGSLEQLVREGAGRLFLKNGTPLVTSGVRVVEPGRVWAAAFDLSAVRAIEDACRGAGLRLRAIAPTAAVLGKAVEERSVVWRDGPLSVEVEFGDGGLVAARRRIATAPSERDAPPRPVGPLGVLGEGAWRFADAYGAALLPTEEPLTLRPGRVGARGKDAPRWRLAAASAALLFATGAALLAPGLAAMRAEREARARVAALADEWRRASQAEDELRGITAALTEVAEFDASRRPVTLLLAELALALPEGSAVTSLRIDTAGAYLTALTPRAAGILYPLERIPGVVGPEIAGPIVRERVGERDLERATFRFGLGELDPEPQKPFGGNER